MIRYGLRTGLAVLVGLIVAFVLIFGVELYSNVVHPFPIGFTGSMDEVCRHVESYPGWVLGTVVVAWGLTAALAAWIAQRIGNVYAATLLGVLLIAAVSLNVSMLPYPMWFEIAVLVVIAAGAVAGARLAIRPPVSSAPPVSSDPSLHSPHLSARPQSE